MILLTKGSSFGGSTSVTGTRGYCGRSQSNNWVESQFNSSASTNRKGFHQFISYCGPRWISRSPLAVK